ncbi:MAG: Zn-dependent hydrolase [Alkalispirochaeta sp.]
MSVHDHIEAMNRFSESDPTVGYSRPTFSDSWRRARDYAIEQAAQVGAEHVVDAAGNVHIRSRRVGWDTPVWLSGSHVDSVPSGGKYDGVMGVTIPLEILRRRPDLPLEVVIFAEEEGTTFGLGLLGSRLWTGKIPAKRLFELQNTQGETYAEAGAPCGVDPNRLAHPADWTDRLDPERYVGLVEVHPEQGLSLWRAGRAISAVKRINGRRQFELAIRGQANHAGSTGMDGRRDALTGAAEVILEVEKLGRRLSDELPYSVLTTGVITARPNAANVIPGAVDLSVEIRAQELQALDRGEEEIRRVAVDRCARRALEVTVERSEAVAPSPLDPEIAGALQRSAATLGHSIEIVPSGALHDAAILAPHLPTAMIFVASRDGISHNPEEYSRPEDIDTALEVLLGMFENNPGGVRASAYQ